MTEKSTPGTRPADTASPDVQSELMHQNHLLIAQVEALRMQLSIRDDEIVRLSRLLATQDTVPDMNADEPEPERPSTPGLRERLGLLRR